MRGTRVQLSILGAMAMVMVQACTDQPSTFVPGVTEKIDVHTSDAYRQADALLQGDYVFVLDYSRSMHDKADEIVTSMQSFGSYLEDESIDYRIGIISGTFQGNVAKTGAWDRISADFIGPFLSLDGKDTMAADITSQTAPLGGDLAPNERSILESGLKTMDAVGSDFLRPSAQLVYVFMSDNEDTSDTDFTLSKSKYTDARTPAFYGQKMVKYKPSASFVSARSFTAGVAPSCALKSTGVGGDGVGTRIAQAARALDKNSDYPTFTDGCVYTPTDDQLKNVARNVTKPTDEFILRGTPLTAASIRVFVDSAEVPSAGNWDYSLSTNVLTFKAGKEPALSSKINITYDQGFYLKRKPKDGSIQVIVGSQLVPQSDTAGWSYVAAENRIQFNGNSRPDDDTKLTITYQVQN